MSAGTGIRTGSQKLIAPSPAMRLMQEGAAAHNGGDKKRAERIYRDIMERYPDFADAWHYLGTLLHERGEAREAKEALERAVRLAPRDVVLLCDMAIVLREQKDYAGSLAAIEQAYEHAKEPEAVLEQHARTFLALERGVEVLEPLRRYFEHYGENWRLRLVYGECLLQNGAPDEARAAFSRAVENAPAGESLPILRRADFNLSRDAAEAARKDYMTARAIVPKSPAPRIGLAVLAAQDGDFAQTEKLARKALALESRAYYAWLLLARLERPREETESFAEELERAAAGAGKDPQAWYLHLARGVTQERLGDYPRAFAAYALGNEQAASIHPTSVRNLEISLADIRSWLGSTFVERAGATGVPDPGVIFICGMPRSGTTLVETILASHPEVVAGGEMRWIHDRLKRATGNQPEMSFARWLVKASDATFKAIATEWAAMLSAAKGGHAFVTDKMPGNFTLLGLIHVCFPRARIVHVRRDPRDACLSYFTTPFAEKNEFSYSLKNTAKYYQYYTALMDHWRSILNPKRIVEVRYEDIVQHPERETRELLAALGLEWDPRCLDFHKTRRSVATASQFQVRKPLYTSSIGRWRHFENQLAPLVAELEKPLAQASDSAPEPSPSVAAPDAAASANNRRGPPSAAAERHLEDGDAALQRGDHAAAEVKFEAALTADPNSAAAHFGLGRLASEAGDFRRAKALLRQALKLDPRLYRCWDELSLIGSDNSRELIGEISAALASAGANPEAWVLYFARGRLREKIGDYDGAFSDYTQGNRPRANQGGYSRQGQLAYARDVVAHLDRRFVARRIAPLPAGLRPIFVCGMYRSGTTLVETILASHPEVAAGGEMRFIHDLLRQGLSGPTPRLPGSWLASRSEAELGGIAQAWHGHLLEAAAGRPWITDKMPPNYTILGLIQVCFPDAPIIHVRRDPRDTCFSCFATPFVEPNSFSRTLADTGHFYRLYQRYMHHWRETLGAGRIIEVEYEELVRAPETGIRRLLAATGLKWDARCLEFYRAGHSVRTASVAQVRRPVYTGSIERWRRFERHLSPLLSELETALPSFADAPPSRFVPPPEAVQRMHAAVAAQRQANAPAAEAEFRELNRRYPRFPDAWHFHGLLLYQRGETDAALNMLATAQDLDPDNVGFLLNFARVLGETGDSAGSAACLERAHDLEPNNAPALFSLAQSLLALGRGGELSVKIRRQANANGNDWRIWMLLGQCCEQGGDLDAALDAYAEACQRAPAGETVSLLAQGEAALKCSRAALAKSSFEAALAIDPGSAGACFNMGRLAAHEGDFQRAESLLREAIGLEPNLYSAWEWLSLISTTPPETMIGELEQVAKRAGENTSAWLLHFSIGREREKLGDYERSFEAYRRGNRMQSAWRPYSHQARIEYTDDIIENLGREFVARRGAAASLAGPQPIFICGMPRSGTSLVEAILAAHPEVSAGGEQRYIHDRLNRVLDGDRRTRPGRRLQAQSDAVLAEIAQGWRESLIPLAGKRAWVTDKMPDNYAILGLIRLCFPNAPIVHVRRDPRDNCLSCYTTPFLEGHAFSNDLENAGQYYRLYERLMRHWREILGQDGLIEVEYEKLASEPEPEIRRLLEALGLDWDAQCLDFHSTRHTVRTASVAQVRQPIYTNSIGRWRRFEPYIEPLFRGLNDGE